HNMRIASPQLSGRRRLALCRGQDSVRAAPFRALTRADRFGPRIWLAGDANFYRGGQTTVDSVRQLDVQRNSRVGWTFSWASDQHHAVRASVSRASIRPSGDFTSSAAAYNYAWTRD